MPKPSNTIAALFLSTRPRQWTKNLVVFSALIFAGRFTRPDSIARSVLAFAVFCLLSGAIYLINDVHDREQDREHASKRSRPIASGALSARIALGAAAGLVLVAAAGSFVLGSSFATVAAGFLLLHLAYTFFLKSQVILDVMAIAAGFVLRAQAGIVAISASFSLWLLVCAALLALVLSLGKRRHELLLLEERAGDHRVTLQHYTTEFIDQMLSAVTAATIVSYTMYTFFSPTFQRHDYLMLTVPFVVYGLFRYMYLVYERDLGGSPEEILLTDVPLMLDIALWLVASIVAMSL
ncbi:MAG: decaprenyl-phosphate phosphoribosyltransferase [Coriobacteriia bacterium]